MKKSILTISCLVSLIVSCTQGVNSEKSANKHQTKTIDVSTKEYSSAKEEYYTLDEASTTDNQNVRFNSESYAYIDENTFKNPISTPLSTFSVDVDNASYTNVRRMLELLDTPPIDAVRVEEFINYFDYDYEQPKNNTPFSISTELSDCPWQKDHKLLHIGLQGKTYAIEEMPPANLVFLLDVSGSMEDSNKLPLLKKSMIKMIYNLNNKDKVSIVLYAGNSGVALKPTSCDQKFYIMKAITDLKSGGGTGGAEGIELAYKLAEEHFIEHGNNRIILATDGDFNIGASSDAEMQRLIESKRDKGIYITVLGFGMGNYKDSKMETIADHGNGNYFYIDDMRATNHILVDHLAGTLMTIAKDVKIQIEFNPNFVASYKLIGYENRVMSDEDFDNDKKDAGDIGAGHSVTALYEIVPGKASTQNELKFKTKSLNSDYTNMAFVKLRYKTPKQDQSQLLEFVIPNDSYSKIPSENFTFSAAVAALALKLRQSKSVENVSFEQLESWTRESLGEKHKVLRSELINMIYNAKTVLEKS